LRQPHEHDDEQIQHGDLHEDGQPDPSWLAGELELAQERPTTSLRGDPNHRKWMLIGVGGCGLITALAVLLLTRETPQAHAQPDPAPAVEQAIETAPEPGEPSEPSTPSTLIMSPKPVEKPTLAATTPIPTTSTQAPPESPAASPSPAPTAAPTATPPAASGAAPSPSPATPADDPPPAAAPASELPDVEPWDDADAASERELSDAS
jgi:cytoskeletal protein RodZ